MDIDILYEDNHLLAVNKPAGLHTQSCAAKNVEDLVKAFLKDRDHKRGNVFLHAIHRLDQPVGGIVLFAKSQKALTRLNASMREKAFRKEYEAVVERKKPALGPLIDYLVHGDRRAHVADAKHPGAKRAELSITAVHAASPGRWKVTLCLITGRYHQIRAQLAAQGMPIVGDTKYGGSAQGQGVILLHHTRLSFPHPTTRVCITITSPATF